MSPASLASGIGAPDSGLPEWFLRATAARLNQEGVRASVEFPGCLVFEVDGRRWSTGYTGLFATDYEGHGDALPGDDALVALEERRQITLDVYVGELMRVIGAATSGEPQPRRAKRGGTESAATIRGVANLLLRVIVDDERGLPPERTVRASLIHRDELADVLGINMSEAADLVSQLLAGIPYQDALGEGRVYLLAASAIQGPATAPAGDRPDGTTAVALSAGCDTAVVVQDAFTATLRERGAALAADRLSSLDPDQAWESYFGPAADQIELSLAP